MAFGTKAVVMSLAVLPADATASATVTDQVVAVNPIRKVVNLLQSMQNKINEEAKKEKELYDNFMCYCKHSAGDLKESLAALTTKVPQVQSDITAAEEQKAQFEQDLKEHQVDRSAAKAAMESATSLREKEAATFAKTKAEYDTNINAIHSAVKALEKGMAGSFLQGAGAQVLKQLVLAKPDMIDMDRQEVMSFLNSNVRSGAGYVPSSGEVTGILKSMVEEMEKDLAGMTKDENEAIKVHEELMSAKTKEVNALQNAIETKMTRVGELGVSIVQMNNDLTDSEAAIIEDQKFLVDMKDNCEKKEAEWQEITKTRSQELVAIAETIKFLNDDDALDLFKKTLPATGSSMLQVRSAAAESKNKALQMILAAKEKYSKILQDHPQFDFIAMALVGRKVGFEKVIKMIDEMVKNLKKEQTDDEHKKEFCDHQMDIAEDKKKTLDRTISDLDTETANMEETLATTKDDIKALEKGIKELDKNVQDATQQRKAEHEDFSEVLASDTAAKEILGIAKNRLNKFYNPKLYKPAAKEELSRQDRISENMGVGGEEEGALFAQVSSHKHTRRGKDRPSEAPEAPGAYKSKSEENSGVVAMIDLLIKDLDKEITYQETTEENAQKLYEETMRDSAEKRALDVKTLTEKQTTMASLEVNVQSKKEQHMHATKDLMATEGYISSLHAECDWMIKYFDVRKEARDEEIDALIKAKAVLNGADYSFVQGSTKGLRR